MPLLAIIIPCYNEADRLNVAAFTELVNSYSSFFLFFVNDGSTDQTGKKLLEIYNHNPDRVKIITLKNNVGKGNAIRFGFLETLETNFEYTAYLDADLSTPTSELIRFTRLLNPDTQIIIASRIKKANSIIKRSYFRHLVGRIIATVIDIRFQLGIYDTQCGTKIFTTKLVETVFEKPFLTSWFFDVEIFLRLRKQNPQLQLLEEPLFIWKDNGKSKLSMLSCFKVCKELLILIKNY